MILAVILHIAATCAFFSPLEIFSAEPLHHVDHPVHTHRVLVYREALFESGLPWGYDPSVGAGLVLSPFRDLGAKPQEVLGVLLPFLPAATVVRFFLFATVLAFPLGTLLASRRLGLDTRTQFWVVVVLIVLLWLTWTTQFYLEWGLAAFVAAAAFAPWVLALFLSFLTAPGLATYLAFVAGLAGLVLLHIQGVWPIAVPLVLYALIVRSLAWKWRLATFSAPVAALALNSFWLVPAWRARSMPYAPEPDLPVHQPAKHLTFADWSSVTAQIDLFWLVSRAGLVVLLVWGFLVMRRRLGARVTGALALAVVWSLFMTYAGSFVPGLRIYQPVRFIVPTLVLMALPLGLALSALVERSHLPHAWAAVGFVVVAVGVALFSLRGPQPLPLPPSPDLLGRFISQRTRPEDRLLIQSADGYARDGFETRILASSYGREILGCTFPQVTHPGQFLRDVLLGRSLAEWSPRELRSALDRWGVSWVFTRTEQARELLLATTSKPGIAVADFTAFQFSIDAGRFLAGNGIIEASVNRIELRRLEPEDGRVVLRYRYHPAWRGPPGLVLEPYPVPEDPAGFIAIRTPPIDVTLRFDPALMLTAQWPDSTLHAEAPTTPPSG